MTNNRLWTSEGAEKCAEPWRVLLLTISPSLCYFMVFFYLPSSPLFFPYCSFFHPIPSATPLAFLAHPVPSSATSGSIVAHATSARSSSISYNKNPSGSSGREGSGWLLVSIRELQWQLGINLFLSSSCTVFYLWIAMLLSSPRRWSPML